MWMYYQLPALVVDKPIRSLLFLTAKTNCPSVSAKEFPNPTALETTNGVPLPLSYLNLCPVNNPWLGIEIALSPLLPGCPACGGVSWSARIVLSLAFTLTTCTFPVPTGFGTVTNPVPIPILFCGLKATNLFLMMFRFVLIPTGNVNLLWSIDNLWPASWNVVIPLCLKTLYLFSVVSISKTLTFYCIVTYN